jgi:P4 family phage/plasmid primase-like protien
MTTSSKVKSSKTSKSSKSSKSDDLSLTEHQYDSGTDQYKDQLSESGTDEENKSDNKDKMKKKSENKNQVEDLNGLKQWINDRIEKDTKKQTHMWFGKNKILFRVKDNEYKNFVNMVARITDNMLENEHTEALHILEVPLEQGIFCIDLDIKFSKDISHKELLRPLDILENINKIVKKYFKLSENKDELICYYMTKEKSFYDETKKLYSDGIHIVYPNLVLDCDNKNFIFDLLIKKLVKSGNLDNLLNELLNDQLSSDINVKYNKEKECWEDSSKLEVDMRKEKDKLIKSIFDRCVFKKTKWFMYGSGKEKYTNKNVYKIKNIYDSDCNIIKKIPKVNKLVKLLAIRDTSKEKTNTNNKYKKYIEKSKREKEKNNFDLKTQSNINSLNTLKNLSELNVSNNTTNEESFGQKSNIELAKKLIKILDKERAKPYETWRNVCFALNNISSSLEEEFIEFSKLSDNFNENSCRNLWKNCVNKTNETNETKKLTIASLKFWAKEDNPIEYEKISNSYLNGCLLEDSAKINDILKNLNFDHDHEVALLIKKLYGRVYVCTSIKNQSWYHFENHRWTFCDVGYKLNNLISEHFTKYIYNMYKQITKEHTDDPNDENKKKKMDMYYKFITKLNKNAYKKLLMSECANTFFDSSFISKLDANPNLIGFENGVYDIKTKEFRDGVPEDYLTYSTGYNYNMEYEENHKDIIEIEKIIRSIQPKPEVYNFMMAHIASVLRGGNKDQKIIFWIGPGGANGKSTIQNLIGKSFGQYYKYIENTIITRERAKSNEACPDILELRGIKITILSELEPGVKINAGFFKRLTGGDPLKGRDLFSSQFIEFIPMFKMILIANNIPEFNSINDDAVWRRIRIINFSQKFVENPKASNEHKIDDMLGIKLEQLKGAFIWLLINKYLPLYDNFGLDKLTPECVKIATNKAKTDTEPYLKFTEEMIEFDKEGFIGIKELKSSYNEWFSISFNKKSQRPAGIIDHYLEKGCEKKGKNIYGIKCKTEDYLNDNFASENILDN